MTPTPAIFGITNDTLNTVAQLALLGLVVVWLALVWFTFADARRRVDDGLVVASATLAALVFPFIGTIVYMIVRPPEYLEDVRERELEMQAAEARLATLEYGLCPHCDTVVGNDFLRCPQCLRKLRDACQNCAKPLDPDWLICPYCEAEIPGVTPQRPVRGRSRDHDEYDTDHEHDHEHDHRLLDDDFGAEPGPAAYAEHAEDDPFVPGETSESPRH